MRAEERVHRSLPGELKPGRLSWLGIAGLLLAVNLIYLLFKFRREFMALVSFTQIKNLKSWK